MNPAPQSAAPSLMPSAALAGIGPGFAEPVHDAQSVFRAALEALSQPGRIVAITEAQSCPAPLMPATAALALALLDADTRLWISPALDGAAPRAWLRFHTGCVVTENSREADFALLADAAEAGDFSAFGNGSDEHPDRSTTLIVQTPALHTGADAPGPAAELRGPGIASSTRLAAAGIDRDFIECWRMNRTLFPRGNDLFLVCGSRLAALPRSVDLRVELRADFRADLRISGGGR